jgi:hypothetical protein
MAYANGVGSNVPNLVTDITNFMVANGGFSHGNSWTYVVSTVDYTVKTVRRDNQVIMLSYLTVNPTHIYLNTCTGNPSTGLPTVQTGACSQYHHIEIGASPLKYWLFSDGFATHCAVEWKAGGFQHINLGYLRKYGSYTGGVFATGSDWRKVVTGSEYYDAFSAYTSRPFDYLLHQNIGVQGAGHVRADWNGLTHHCFMATGGQYSAAHGVAANIHMVEAKGHIRSPNSYNGRTVLIPMEIAIAQTAVHNPSSWIPVGRVDNIANINLTNLNPGDTLLTDWIVFPYSAKNVTGTVALGYLNSGVHGLAYKK